MRGPDAHIPFTHVSSGILSRMLILYFLLQSSVLYSIIIPPPTSLSVVLSCFMNVNVFHHVVHDFIGCRPCDPRLWTLCPTLHLCACTCLHLETKRTCQRSNAPPSFMRSVAIPVSLGNQTARPDALPSFSSQPPFTL